MLASDWAAFDSKVSRSLRDAARRPAYRTLEGCALYARDHDQEIRLWTVEPTDSLELRPQAMPSRSLESSELSARVAFDRSGDRPRLLGRRKVIRKFGDVPDDLSPL